LVYSSDERGICPNGWHVPSDEEWIILIDYLGGNDVAGGKMKSTQMSSSTNLIGWNTPNTGASNVSGFSGLPSGARRSATGNFEAMGTHGAWWSSTQPLILGYPNPLASISRFLHFENTIAEIHTSPHNYGICIRCVKD